MPLYRIIDSILLYQESRNIQGDFLEIGVLHGATSGYLSLSLDSRARLFLIDPFQNLEEVAGKIAAFADVDSTRILCLAEDSRVVYKMRSIFLDGFLPRLQIVHIDGEHSYDAVLSDMKLAESYIMDGGLIILDDIFNVASACCTHALFDSIAMMPSLHIACIGFNKAFVCDSRFLEAYRSLFLGFPVTFERDYGLYIRACLNDWSRERGYVSIHEIDRGEPKFQAINRVADDYSLL